MIPSPPWYLVVLAVYTVLVLAVVALVVAGLLLDPWRRWRKRRRARISSNAAHTYVEDPLLDDERYANPLRVTGGSGAGSTTAHLADDEEGWW